MDNFERVFNTLYPKTLSKRIKLMGHIRSHIEQLEKEHAMDPDNFKKENELIKWRQVEVMIRDKEPMEKVDKIVLSGIFPQMP